MMVSHMHFAYGLMIYHVIKSKGNKGFIVFDIRSIISFYI